jgi:hypothetical protein
MTAARRSLMIFGRGLVSEHSTAGTDELTGDPSRLL